MRWGKLARWGALALALIWLLSAAPAEAQSNAPVCNPAKRTGRFFVTLPVDGAQRSALVNVPPSDDGTRPLPVVLVFHGASSTGPATERHLGLTQLGDRDGFIAVYPTSNGDYFDYWSTGPGGDDDVIFTRDLLDYLDQNVCVDDARIYATGGSNGGAFVARLGCELSDRLAAIAIVAGVFGKQPACQPVRPISMLEIHGSNDRYHGYPPLGWEPVPLFLDEWKGLDDCPRGRPADYHFAFHTILADSFGCADGTLVAHIKLLGGIHAWPGAFDLTHAPRVDFRMSASLAIWQFFQCEAQAARSGGPCPPRQVGRAARRRAPR